DSRSARIRGRSARIRGRRLRLGGLRFLDSFGQLLDRLAGRLGGLGDGGVDVTRAFGGPLALECPQLLDRDMAGHRVTRFDLDQWWLGPLAQSGDGTMAARVEDAAGRRVRRA